MLCPFCHHQESQVIDSRQSTYNNIEGIRRRRQCSQCHQRFSSFEMTINDLEGVEPATLDGILQQIIKIFRDAPRTNYKALSDVQIDNKVSSSTNEHNKPLAQPKTPSSVNGKITSTLTSKDIKEALRRARKQIAKEMDELDASEFDDTDFD